MPIEKVRILSLLVLGASVTTWLHGVNFFLVQIMVVIPIWFPIPLDRVRKWPVWKIFGLLSLGQFCYHFFWGDMLLGVFLLVMFCVAYELYGELRKTAPVRLLSLISFLIVIHMTSMDSGMGLIVAVWCYFFSAVFCLTAFNLGQPYNYKILPFLKAYGLPMIPFSAMSFAAGLIVFWFMPRVPESSLSALPSLTGDNLSGFSDRVTLTDIGSLKLSRKHVMDVTPLSGGLHSPYLKGRVMDHYDQGVWSSNGYDSFKESWNDDVYTFTEPEKRTYDYKVDLDPLHGNVIFFFDTLVQLKGRLSPLKVEGYLANISIYRKRPLAVTYYITASQDPLPMFEREFGPYLQVPSNHEYLAELASQVLGGDAPLSNGLKALALKDFFLNNFTYTLDVQNSGVRDPLEAFLMETRKGHCELFASSMVLMMRSQGIPARLVTGFVVNEMHPSGAYYYVTEANAHAWTEIYYDNAWHVVDPTPPMLMDNLNFIGALTAYLSRQWRAWVLTFDYDSQSTLFKAIREKTANLFLFLKSHPKFTLGILLVLLWFAFNLRTGRLFEGVDSLTRVFKRLNDFLQDRIAPRLPQEGVYDYVTRLDLDPDLRTSLVQFLQKYHRFRFGPPGKRAGKNALMKQGRQLLSRLKKVPKKAVKQS